MKILALDFYQNEINPPRKLCLNPSVSSEASVTSLQETNRDRNTHLNQKLCRWVLSFCKKTQCPSQTTLKVLKHSWTGSACEHLIISCSRGPAGPAIPQLLILAGPSIHRPGPGSHYVLHGFTTCGPSCLLLLDVMVPLAPDSVWPLGRNLPQRWWVFFV